MKRRPLLPLLFAALAALPFGAAVAQDAAKETKPIKALLITGGGYHDYKTQKKILTEGISARANVEWTVKMFDDNGEALPEVYKDPNWIEGYDVIVHNECYAAFKDAEKVKEIVKAHTDREIGVVLIHCAMHTFRDVRDENGENPWWKLMGCESDHHGPHLPIDTKVVKSDHAIMKGFPARWKTPKGELYVTKLTDGEALLTGSHAKLADQVCAWTNRIGKAKVFATTLAHFNEEMETEEFLGLTTRGLLWSVGKLEQDGTPAPGYGPKAAKTAEK